MVNASAEAIGQALIVVAFGVVGAYRLWVGHKQSSGKPPENRPPPRDDFKEACSALCRELAKLQDKIEHHTMITSDDMRELQRQMDRIEAALRVNAAIEEIRRQYAKGKD